MYTLERITDIVKIVDGSIVPVKFYDTMGHSLWNYK